MDCKDRISQAADAEYPGCAVIFDDQAGDTYRFQVESGNGRVISRTYPIFNDAQIEAKTDEELRALVRQVCGR